MKFTKKILTENLFIPSDSPKFFTKGKKQSVMISEDQLDRLMNVVKGDLNVGELDKIIKEANNLIRHAILKENLNLSIGDYQMITEQYYTKDSEEGATYTKDSGDGATYDLEEQGQYNRDPGIAAGEGLEVVLDGIKKAYDMIKDSDTRKKLANSITKLGNFMTITADALGSGRDQRAMKPAESLRDPLPYPELDVNEIATGDYKLTKEETDYEAGMRYMHGDRDDAAIAAYEKGDKKKETTEVAKPDFLDLDGDGNKKESMKKASKDKIKKESVEGKNRLIQEDIRKMKQIINPIIK